MNKENPIAKAPFHFVVIADYGGIHAPDPAFTEVDAHLRRFDGKRQVAQITEHPVAAFCTLETGFWIEQVALHNDHPGLVIFSNTAPRGDIAWRGQKDQAFVYGKLDNGVPIFAVNSGYNLSFVKDRLDGPIRKVNVPNTGTQFRSRDQYPAAAMGILQGNEKFLGEELDPSTIPDVPESVVASIDGYGNLKTTIRKSSFTTQEALLNSPILRVSLNRRSHFAKNTLSRDNRKGETGDLCVVVGSSGGKKDPFIEIIKLQESASDEFKIENLADNLGQVVIEPLENIIFAKTKSA